MATRTRPQSEKERWFDGLKAVTGDQPRIIPAVGVTIECRILVESVDDWQYVRDTLDSCREHGAAEVVNHKVFEGERR